MTTLQQFNEATDSEALAMLDGVYGEARWIIERAVAQRPFASLARLKLQFSRIVREADEDAALALIRADPVHLRSGLANCSPAEFERLQALDTAYRDRFGFPFALALGGSRGKGLARAEILATFERRLQNHPEFERSECLRNIHRIAELRLDDRFGSVPAEGESVWDRAERLAQHSDPGFKERGLLTVTYLTEAHRACAAQLLAWMRADGFDETGVDAVGNVWGRYRSHVADAKTLYTGSHYDTVRNAGKYDGRLGILVPLAVVARLRGQNRRLPFHLEVIGFAEEEGQRYKATFLGSGAVIGQFDRRWLDQADADGVKMRAAMHAAGLDPSAIDACRRDPATALGFIEVHIEQGPVLNELDLPLGVVTSINGGSRFMVEVIGTASHAGTTPMDRRRDAVGALAELALYLEKRAAADSDSVGTIGVLEVPSGSINVVAGRCRFSLDLRAPRDEQRLALNRDVLAELDAICTRRGLRHTVEETFSAKAAPSDPVSRRRWERAVTALGLPAYLMPSGAGHDAMKLHEVMPQAMLFVRGGNAGISHNPLEEITADDAQLCVDAFAGYLGELEVDLSGIR